MTRPNTRIRRTFCLILILSAMLCSLALPAQFKSEAAPDNSHAHPSHSTGTVPTHGQVEEDYGKLNYFIGNDPQKWRTEIPTYGQVRYNHVYPGIDLVYYGAGQRELEYDFVVEGNLTFPSE